MKPRTEVIDHQIVNSIAQLASALKPGDIFRRINSKTRYSFDELKLDEERIRCRNLETGAPEFLYYNAPVLKLVFI